MEIEQEDLSPETAFEKDPFGITVEDVYDMSHVIGKDLMKISKETRGATEHVADLQFKIVRVLEILETLVNQSSLSAEEVKMERDNLKAEVERLMKESPSADQTDLGPDKMVIDLRDPNRPRFTLQELREVLQERNKLKVQLLVAQDELQCYKSGIIPPTEDHIVTLENESIITTSPRPNGGSKEKSTIGRLFSPFKQEKQEQ
ncbi:RILP-like protein 2 [Engystomops pustulosus]|uniref:RILP-like protein 2 n=1 Tax=Engystomops pustulosus TaxID=76066 RepID=UPI003AFAE776